MELEISRNQENRVPVWRNPSSAEFGSIRAAVAGTFRAILTESDLYLWQAAHLSHADFVRQAGIDGVRLQLHTSTVFVNEETAVTPDRFPWFYADLGTALVADMEVRCCLVTVALAGNPKLGNLYPGGFKVDWYM